ncbi:hypothetical protein N306_03648, partial [Opisthocomus hoazin]
KMTAFLPRIMEMLQHDDTDVTMKVLELFRNVLGHLTRDKTGPIAVLLVEQLPPLFEHKSSWMRELSFSLFRDLLQSVVGDDEQMMKTKVWSFLVPLFFHMSDQVDSVAQ